MKKSIMFALSLIALGACSDYKKEIVGSWIEVMPSDMNFIQGVTLKDDGTALSIGMETLKYSKWELDGKSLLLSGESIGNIQTISFTDTMKIVKLTPDSLVLENEDYTMKYYKEIK